jgi:integrin beta 3
MGPAGAPGPPGEKGDPGERGEKGEPGRDGKSIDPAEIEKMVRKILDQQVAVFAVDLDRKMVDLEQKLFDKIPPPIHGKDGRDGRDGKDGEPGRPGADGLNGKDGRDGIDGKDGLGVDDFSVDLVNDKQLQMVLQHGERRKECLLTLPILVDRGTYQSGSAYTKGDCVTYGGSLWIAQVDNPTQSPGKGDHWRLAVKRGRDAREVT